MSHYLFNVVIEEDEMEDGQKAFSAHCPALPGCSTYGLTHAEALENIREAVEAYIESLRKHGEQIPLQPIEQNGHAISLSAPSVLVNA